MNTVHNLPSHFFLRSIVILPPRLGLGLQSGAFPLGFTPKSCLHLFPTMWDTLHGLVATKYNNTLVCNLLRISPASDYWIPTFRNTLSVPSSKAGYEVHIQPLKMEQIKCSETSAFNNQTPGKYPKRLHTILKTQRKFEIKKLTLLSWLKLGWIRRI